MNNKQRRKEIKTWFWELKKQYRCARCGESHPACLEFHHANGEDKDFSIGNAVIRGFSKERIMKEITKCIPLCANCHRKLHFEHETEHL